MCLLGIYLVYQQDAANDNKCYNKRGSYVTVDFAQLRNTQPAVQHSEDQRGRTAYNAGNQ